MLRPDLLIKKLKDLKVNPAITDLTKSFLTDRTACVIHGSTGTSSDIRPVIAGVPQGTLYGPIRWNIYVHDMPLPKESAMYADDTTLYYSVISKSQTNHQKENRTCKLTLDPDNTLQQAASTIYEWSLNNFLSLNTSKTKGMMISLKDDLQLDDSSIININSETIGYEKKFKLLGILIDQHLTFRPHIQNIASRCRYRIHILLMLKRYGINCTGLLKYYRSNIRSLLSYACPAWYPYICDVDKKTLESIQRLSFRIINPDICYHDFLKQFSMPSICDFLDKLCVRYVYSVASKTEHPNRLFLPAKQSDGRRHSNRLRDAYICASRTAKFSRNVFYTFL